MPENTFKKPPFAGGPRRVPEELPAARSKPKSAAMSALKKALIAGGSTGIGIGFGLLIS